VTIGIHSGEAVTGVIGHRMPRFVVEERILMFIIIIVVQQNLIAFVCRYCLFGNTVNITSRTETTGVPGKINVSEETYK